MTAAQRESTLHQLDLQLRSTIAQEKERALEEARKAITAFPSLSGQPPARESSLSPPAVVPAHTHKVMSLKQNNKVVVSSFTPALVPPPETDGLEEEDEPNRIPPPPSEPLFSRVLPNQDRPWENLIKGASTYIPKHRLDDDDGNLHQSRSHRKRNKEKAKGKEKEQHVEEPNQDEKEHL